MIARFFVWFGTCLVEFIIAGIVVISAIAYSWTLVSGDKTPRDVGVQTIECKGHSYTVFTTAKGGLFVIEDTQETKVEVEQNGRQQITYPNDPPR